MLFCFNKTSRGAGHIKSDKACQDYSVSISESEMSVAIVSDGHGGERYFRSGTGSRIACEVCLEMIRQFTWENSFKGSPFTRIGVNWDIPEGTSKEMVDILKRLTCDILSHWKEKIKADANEHPLTDEERAKVPAEYHNLLTDKDNFAKVYGCTLMAYVQTPDYWIAFQIGDGKCISFHEEREIKQPISSDAACFLNKTTSLCDSNAANEFRCTFQGDGKFPYAVILGSDGLDDSFGEDKNLINFYIQLLKLAFKSDREEVEETLSQDLPILSERGSHDDMSVAAVVDKTAKMMAIPEMIDWQLNNVKGELNHNKERIRNFYEDWKSLFNARQHDAKAAIDFDYAEKEIKLAVKSRKKLIDRINALYKELDPKKSKIFNDDLDYDKLKPFLEPAEPKETNNKSI